MRLQQRRKQRQFCFSCPIKRHPPQEGSPVGLRHSEGFDTEGATSYLCKVNGMGALALDHEPRAVAAIASRFNRVEPSHGQEAFASASTASPQLACRLAATPGHESGLTPDTNRHEKLGVSTQGSGVRSWREELFSFPVPHSCSLRGRRIRVRRRPHSCRGHQTQTEGRGGTETTCEGRLSEWVSCVWGSGGAGKRPSSNGGYAPSHAAKPRV